MNVERKERSDEAESAARVARRAASQDFAAEHAKLLKDYRDLVEGVRMIRRAADRASRAGVLPAGDQSSKTPLQECESIARAIYRLVLTSGRSTHKRLPGLAPYDPAK